MSKEGTLCLFLVSTTRAAENRTLGGQRLLQRLLLSQQTSKKQNLLSPLGESGHILDRSGSYFIVVTLNFLKHSVPIKWHTFGIWEPCMIQRWVFWWNNTTWI